MTNLEELIDIANKLSNRLGESANNEMKFGVDLCLRLEQMSWEALRWANDLQELKGYI